jgi:hypothetical protein
MMRAEDIERLAPGLGERAEAAVDPERVAHAVTERLRAAATPRRGIAFARWIAVAAAVALMVGGAVVTFGTNGTGREGPRVAAAAPGLYDLSATELEVVLDSLNERGLPQGSATLDDLDAEQLRQLLALMEG